MRHVLIVCYDFPRISAAGVIRTYQFAKSLPDFGWQPVILTAQACDRKCENNIEISDGRLPCPRITARPMRVPFQFHGEKSWIPFDGTAWGADGRIKRMISAASRLPVPDGKIGWLAPAVKQGLRIARDYPLQVCFSVSPRPTAHLVARTLARRLNIPWVADYALPWSDAYWLAGRPRVVQWLDERIEERIVRSAQRLTVAYPEIARSLDARYGGAVAEKVAVVPTGFDNDLFAQLTPETARKFTVIYPGNHFCEQGRNGEAFLDAVDQWIDRDPSLEGKVEFVFIGKSDEALLRQRAAMAHRCVIRVEPLISHRACVQAILSSHLCVVNTVGQRIPAKVYECMRAGKRILALTEPGSDLASIIGQYSAGVVVPAQNGFAIQQALENAWRCGLAPAITSVKSDRCASLYSAKEGARALASNFDGLLRSQRGGIHAGAVAPG